MFGKITPLRHPRTSRDKSTINQNEVYLNIKPVNTVFQECHEVGTMEDSSYEERQKVETERLTLAVSKTIKYIMSDWNYDISSISILSHVQESEITGLIKAIPETSIDKSNLNLLVNFIAIHKNLDQMFSSRNNSTEWLNNPHPNLNKQKPIDIIASSTEGLKLVRKYLDINRGNEE